MMAEYAPRLRSYSGAALFACANLHPGVPARAQQALRVLRDSADLAIEAPPAPQAVSTQDRPTPPPLIRPDKPAPRWIPPNEATGRLLAKIDTAALHNRLWRTNLEVTLAGRRFAVSGQQSRQANMHMVVTDLKNGKPYFLRDLDLLTGFYQMRIGGKAYRVHLKPEFDLFASKLQFLEGLKLVERFAVRDIMKGMYEAGEAADLGGRTFRMHYTDQIFEGDDGRVERYGEPLFVLMVEQRKGTYDNEKHRYRGDAVEAERVTSDDFLRTAFRIPPYGLFYYDLKRSSDGKAIEVYEVP